MSGEDRRIVVVGQEHATVNDLVQVVADSLTAFDFIVVPLVHPRYRRDLTSKRIVRDTPLTRSDLLLGSQQWTTSVVGRISSWLNLDAESEAVRRNAELAFKQEIAWASHLSLPAIILPSPGSLRCNNYARMIQQMLLQLTFTKMWMRIPLVHPASMLEDPPHGLSGTEPNKDASDPWQWWNRIRTLCEHHSNLQVVLEVTSDLPSVEVLDKWFAEPVRALILPTNIFLTNKKGYPCLSKKHQQFVTKMYQLKVQFIVRGTTDHPEGLLAYRQYIDYLIRKVPDMSEGESYEESYYDYLQMPLQPLMDNLESQTYETFERDDIKYILYEEAVRKALLDRAEPDSTTVIMVLGAGRGPLVNASLRAAAAAERKVRMYAVEKNPNALVTLRNMKVTHGWGDTVTVISSDMRAWNPPEKADIIVSELLGSFGDNELSPECLDGALKVMKDDGISIPCKYTSYVAPITTTRLWNEVKNYGDLTHFETAYVVRLFAHKLLAKPQALFTFEHPNRDDPIDNTRTKELTFESPTSALLHGFGGYFDCQLYGDVWMSIHPETHTPEMHSWFPIYIPLRSPIYCPPGSTIRTHFSRNVSPTKVWYEWMVSSPDASPIHNPNGRSYWIGL